MGSPEPFAGARLKVKWAIQHIDRLQATLNSFLEGDFYRLAPDPESETGSGIYEFVLTKPLPEEVPLIIGDVVHNLRSALDYVAWEIVVGAGKEPSNFLDFPFRWTRKEVIGAVNGEIQAAGSDFAALIIDGIQPYVGGNGESLFQLHRLDLLDKHRILIPLWQITGLYNVRGHYQGDGKLIDFMVRSIDGKKTRIPNFGGTGTLAIDDYGKPAFHVLFAPGQPFSLEAVIPTLHNLSQAISAVIDEFSKAYLARTQGRAQDAPPP